MREEYSIVAGLSDDVSGPIEKYYVAVPAYMSSKLASIGAVMQGTSDSKPIISLVVEEMMSQNLLEGTLDSNRIFAVTLPQPLSKDNRRMTFAVSMSWTDRWTPGPTVATQDSPLNVHSELSPYFYSPYPTVAQKVALVVIKEFSLNTLECPEPRDTQPTPAAVLPGAQMHSCGVYNNILPFKDAMGQMRASIRLGMIPWIKIKKLDRTFKLDLLNKKIHVTDEYEFVHHGHRLNNEAFSKTAYIRMLQEQQQKSKPLRGQIVPTIPIAILSTAENVKIQDEIGLLHATSIRREVPHNRNYHIFEFQPRFPLHGGWSYYQKITYSLPMAGVVTLMDIQTSSLTRKAHRLMMPIFELINDLPIEELTLKVVVPGEIETIGSFPIVTGIDNKATSRTHRTIMTPLRLGMEYEYKTTFNNVIKEHQVAFVFLFDYSWWSPYRSIGLMFVVTIGVVLALASLGDLNLSLGWNENDNEKRLSEILKLMKKRKIALNDLNNNSSEEPDKVLDSLSTYDHDIISLLEVGSSLRERHFQLGVAALKKTYEEQICKIRRIFAENDANVKSKLEIEAIDLDERILRLETRLISA